MKNITNTRKANRILQRVLAFCAALLCLAAFLGQTAAAKETPALPLPEARSVFLRGGATEFDVFTAPATGIYQLWTSDVLLKEGEGLTLEVCVERGTAGDSFQSRTGNGFGRIERDDEVQDYGGEDKALFFAAKKGDTVTVEATATSAASFVTALTFLKPTALTQGEAAAVTLTQDVRGALFSFTPAKEGYYSFRSSNADCDPMAVLYDEDTQIAWDDDSRITLLTGGDSYGLAECGSGSLRQTLNFTLSERLEAGKTYYLIAQEYGNGAGTYDLTVMPSVLSFASDFIDLPYHGSVRFSDLFDECTYSYLELSDFFSLGTLDNAVSGERRGEQTITFSTPDGKIVRDVTFQVQYSARQRFAAIALGGWAWMPKTPVLAPGETLWSHWKEQISQRRDEAKMRRANHLESVYWALQNAIS